MRIGIQIIYLILVALMMPSRVGAFDHLRVTGILVVVAASILTEWLLYSDSKNVFRLDVLFVFGFIIVHFQWPLMFLSDVKIRHLRIESFIDSVSYGTWLSALGLIAWFIGWGSFKFEKKRKFRILSVEYEKLKWAFYMCFALFLLFAGKDYLTGAVYRGDSDSAAASGLGAYFQLLLGFVVITAIAFYLPVAAAKIRKHGRWWQEIDILLLIVLGLYTLMFLAVGDRGGAIEVACALMLIYGMLVHPITKKQFCVLAIVGALVLTIIGLGRSSGSKSGDKNMLSDGVEKLETMDTNSAYILTLELANSSTCLYAAIDNVPTQHSFFYGKLWRGNLLAVVPLSQQIVGGFFEMKPDEMGSGGYITYLFYGDESVVGAGSSIIADLYLNWGEVGVVVFMFGLGVLYKRIHQGVVNRESLMWVVAAGALATVAFYAGRGGYLIFLRPVIWSLVIAKMLTTIEMAPVDNKKSKIKP